MFTEYKRINGSQQGSLLLLITLLSVSYDRDGDL